MFATTQDDLTAQLLSVLQEARRAMSSTELLGHFPAGDARDEASGRLETMLAADQIARRPIPKTDLVVYWIPSRLAPTPAAPPARKSRPTAQEALERDIASLRTKVAELENERQALEAELKPGTDVDAENAAHIKRLHDYNEVKDTGQMLLGKLAEFEGTTTRAMYERFDLGLED
ncbi:swi5-like zinc finger protein [Geranomyces variabilis]|nr:swi5-like zinc finger protein [Geranomyces variabilis]